MNSESPIVATPADRPNYSLDDLIALNDELVALVRSGMPLERGLSLTRRDLKGGLQQLTDKIGQHVERGASLDEALRAPDVNLPPLYGAVVEAGIRSGRLAIAMEQMGTTARRIVEARRTVTMASLYPLLVFTLTCFLIGVLGQPWVEAMGFSHNFHGAPMTPVANTILSILEVAGPYLRWTPCVLIPLFALWWLVAGRARTAQPRSTAWLFRCVPGLSSLIYYSTSATFCEVLALLLDHQTPLHEALTLAGASSGDHRLQLEATDLGEKIRQGQQVGADRKHAPRIPPLVRWLLSAKQSTGQDARAIHAAADGYRRQATYRVEWLRVWLPLLLVGLVSIAVVLFAMSIFVPWAGFMSGLSNSPVLPR